MAYLDKGSLKNRPGAIAAVVGIHAVIGYTLVTGLSFTQFTEAVSNPEGIFIDPMPIEPPPPPPPPPDTPVEPQNPIAPLPYTPPSTLDLKTDPATIDTSTILLPPIDEIIRVVPTPGPTASASPAALPKPKFDPVAAKPRNAPGSWVTQNDYRSSWINRGMDGLASFRVTIGADGRVKDCAITRSSGHSALDEATCANVTRRARFEPARNANGDAVAGTFASTVQWQIPD